MEQKNIIVEKSLDFSVENVKFCELLESKRKYVVAKQLLRSGTSMGQMFLKLSMLKVKLTLFIK